MLELDKVIWTFFSSIIYVLIIEYLNFKNVRLKKTTIVILFLSILVCTLFINTFIETPGIRFPIVFVMIVFFCVGFYGINIFESIALALICVFIVLVADSALLWFFVNVMKLDVSRLNNTLFVFIANLIFLIITIIVILVRQFFKRRNNIKISIKVFFLICVLFIVVICTMNLSFNNKIIQTNPTTVLVFNLVAFAIYFFICLFLVFIYTSSSKQQILLNQQTKEYEQLIEYTMIIEKLYDDIRNQKHDFMNVLFSLKGYMDKEQYEELKDYYYNSVLKEYKEKQPNLFTTSLNLIQNPGLKGLISYKTNQAVTSGIKVYINIFSEIKIKGIDNLDLCKIIGILIDNAIEASLESEQKEIHFGIERDDAAFSIIIANTYLIEPKTDMIYKRGYSTKGENRGLGLFNVKEILSHYPSVQLKATINNNTFFQELIIPDPNKPIISS